MQNPDTLIRTKLHPPFTRPGLVARLRLQERIAQGLRLPLTLVTAPAGFGKTTLVASCAADCGIAAAWLSLDQNDNQPARFLTYLAAALQSVEEQVGADALILAAGMQPAAPEAILTSLINDLDTAGREIALVLDDYQLITSQTVHDQVTFLLEHCPHTLHLVIATRSDPPLPLARLRSRGLMVELRAADLRFTLPEAASFLNDVMGLHLAPEAVASLAQRTEGWIAGLQMAALSMRDRKDVDGFIQGFSGSNRFILDYLLEEVLACQPPEIQRFLLYTSVLERLTAPLCDAVFTLPETGVEGEAGSNKAAPDPQSFLDYLDRTNLFLVSLDDERKWYRYHHLFADLLQARLLQTEPDLVPRLHLRAAAWLEQNGLVPEAISHLLTAQETDRAADLIETYGPPYTAQSDPSVFNMARSLPSDVLVRRPKICLYLAWFLVVLGQTTHSLQLLAELEQQHAVLPTGTDQGWMGAFSALIKAFLSPPGKDADLPPLPEVRQMNEIPYEDPVLRNAAEFLYCMTLARRDQHERAAEVSLRCIEREKQQHGGQAIPTLAPFLARLYLILGRLHDSADLAREFLNPVMEKNFRFLFTSGSMKIDLGEVYSEWNHLEEAETLIREGLKANETWRNIMTDGFGLIALVRVLLAKRDYSGALQAVGEFESRMQTIQPQPREFDEDIRTLRTRVLLASGDLHAAALWAEEVEHNPEYINHLDLFRLVLARIRLAQNRFGEVKKLLDGAALPGSAGSLISRQLESSLLLAAAAAGQQRMAEAVRRMDSILKLAESEGHLRIFLDVGEPVRDLLSAYLRSADPAAASAQHRYARQVLAAFPVPGTAAVSKPQPPGLVEPITEREIEVLELMSQGLTNQQIAAQLFVARGTVKAHAASIYRKLDVANRTEAVARARQLKLLL